MVILSCLPKEVYAAHDLHSKIIELHVFQEKFKKSSKKLANSKFGIYIGALYEVKFLKEEIIQ